jgi:hypothetical protein
VGEAAVGRLHGRSAAVTHCVVYATPGVLRAAECRGIFGLETRVEEAISARRCRRRTLGGVSLPSHLRHVILDARTGVIVERGAKTPGGRRRYRAVRLLDLRPLRPRSAR